MSRRQLVCLVTGVGVTAWAVTYHFVYGNLDKGFILFLYAFNAALIVFYIGSVHINEKLGKQPIRKGRTVAIIPAYEEEPGLLRAAIEALTTQTVPVDEIHVMDDGSDIPVEPFYDYPNVVWHRQDNGGKRYAQAGVLQTLNPDDWDYILTVDSDSVLDSKALEYLQRAMSNEKVMAATGMILTRNWNENLLTRITDVNIGTSCLMIRSSRSAIGSVETTSGALALYRSDIVFDNLEDYVSSGTNGDDRRLTCYALLKGDVVVVNEALVHSAMPTTIPGMFRQRLRWGKSAWQALPFTLTNLSGKKVIFPVLAVIQWSLLPLMLGWVIMGLIFREQTAHVWAAFGAYMMIRCAETGLYLLERPGMAWYTKLWTWIILTPTETLIKLFIIYPAKYYAILKLRERGWHSRGNAHSSKADSKVG